MVRYITTVTACALICLLVSPAMAANLLSENFDGLTLTDSVDEGVAGPVGDPGGSPGSDVWTDVAPAGWVLDSSGVPGNAEAPDNDGVREWSGWSFANRDWWVTTAGDQDRSQFTNASGTVMVADPDEWDDADHPGGPADGPWYSTFLSTPQISLAGIEAGSVTLDFDSSWRPEFDDNYHQTANIVVSYDGGAAVEVLRWESDAASADYHGASTNEHVSLGLNNPEGAGEMSLSFGLFDAGNDWWWAVDNIEVNGVPEPSTFVMAMLGGLLCLSGRRRKRGA